MNKTDDETRFQDGDKVTCLECGQLFAVFSEDSPDGIVPGPEELLLAKAVPVAHVGWFCGQQCGHAFERKIGCTFQRDLEGKSNYYGV
ncbi:hypothetical protein ACO0LG_09105 [Undibacterium sp. Ji42W]|uniref:hypothetical protein n=1 Tax=Undibacterium sp. Ji42W TaxID=3413039 RepID=UPI003BF33E8C